MNDIAEKELEEKIDKEVEADKIKRETEEEKKHEQKRLDKELSIKFLNMLPSLRELLDNKNMLSNLIYALTNKTRKMDSLPILRTALMIEMIREQNITNNLLEKMLANSKEDITADGKKLLRKRNT